jgi:pyruvate kinase
VTDPFAAQSPEDLTATYPYLVQELKVGDLILLTDGTVSMQVVEKTPGAAIARVIQPGEIRSGGGINLPGVELGVGALTDNDREALRWGASQDIDFFGLSFVRSPADVRLLRDELARLESRAQIVAKIEKPQAVEFLDQIIEQSDAIMVARGDLGVEIDVARMASVQKQIIRRCREVGVPVITATQMLESMRSNRLPTRAEATDVANAILDGSDALMLSAETAIGLYPVEAVAMMSRIAREAERLVSFHPERRTGARSAPGETDITRALVEGTIRIADQVQARLVIVATRSGNTARILSNQRGRAPIIGISDNEEVARRMCLYWGVVPLQAPRFSSSGELLTYATAWAHRFGIVRGGERVVLIASTNWTTTTHDMIVVHEIGAAS